MTHSFDVKDLIINEWSSKDKSSWLNPVLYGVQVIHLPSGIVVEVEEHRSQHLNKQAAMQELEERLKGV